MSFTSSHQQPALGAPQSKSWPQAPHFFCVGAHLLRCVAGVVAVTLWPLGVMGMRLREVAFEDFYDLLFGHGADDLVGYLPALEN